jgi:hypothetical protein
MVQEINSRRNTTMGFNLLLTNFNDNHFKNILLEKLIKLYLPIPFFYKIFNKLGSDKIIDDEQLTG